MERINASGLQVEAKLDPVTGDAMPYRADDDHAVYRDNDPADAHRTGRDGD